jgi:hypothetical protein
LSIFGIDQLNIDTQGKANLRVFLDSWSRHRGPVLFVGAGFSKFQARQRTDISQGSKFGSWADLMDDFMKCLGAVRK